jgi:hypothetical protein
MVAMATAHRRSEERTALREAISFSPLLLNGGGEVLLPLPYEALGYWKPSKHYEALLDCCLDLVQMEPLGASTGVVVNDMDGDGILEAHWLRLRDQPGVILVVWSEWADPARKYCPEDLTKVARAWLAGEDPRQAWLQ